MLNEELADVNVLVHRCSPALLKLDGVGQGAAATLLVAAGDNPHRLTAPHIVLRGWLNRHRSGGPQHRWGDL